MDSTNDTSGSSSGNGAASDGSPPTRNPHRRVKVYMLNSDRAWDDKGTGHVSCAYVERFQGMALIVRSEDDDRTVILESKVCPNTAYQKQQETLICWSENEQELALSFQLMESCSEIWEKICDVQGRDPGDNVQEESLHDSREDEHFDDSYASTLLIELPTVDLAHLSEIQTIFNEHTMHGGGVHWRMEKLATSIEADDYISKLLDLFLMCDDLENTEALHQLYSIFKTVFMLNKNALFELMFSSENLMKVVGVMEYDPCKKAPVKHRHFLENQAKFHHVLPLKNEALLNKIHQTYRVQYIQDVILPTPSVFDENVLSALTSFVFFNKCEIVKMIQEDESAMKSLFHQLTDDETDDAARRNLIKFLKEFCMFSSSLQASERDQFFQSLSDMRILEAIETLWNLEDAETLSTTNDVFAFLADTNPSMVREFCLSEAKLGQGEFLMIKAIEQMQGDLDPELGGAWLLSSTIRLLIDPENMLTNTAAAPALRTEKTEFLNYFYTHCMQTLLSPLRGVTKEARFLKDDYRSAQLLHLTVELLAFCAEHHSYNFRVHMIKHEVMKKVLCLLKCQHAFLALSVVRFVRRIVGLKDETYNRHIINGDHMRALCEAFIANGNSYNLFNSAVIELFEYIRVESIRSLAHHFVDCHYNSGFHTIEYVKTFSQLKDQFDSRPSSEQDNHIEERAHNDGASSRPKRCRCDNSSFDEEEEMWFEREDEDLDTAGNPSPPFQQTEDSELGMELLRSTFPKTLSKKVEEEEDSDMPFSTNSKLQRTISINLKSLLSAKSTPQPSSPPAGTSPNLSPISKMDVAPTVVPAASAAVKGLVDYPDEDSDDDTDVDSAMACKKVRLDNTSSTH